MPLAPVLTGPSGSLDRSASYQLAWTWTNEFTGETMQGYILWRRLNGGSWNTGYFDGSGAWVVLAAGHPGKLPFVGLATIAPNALAVGVWEFQAVTYGTFLGSPTTSPQSNTVTFTMADAPAAPTITSPADGGTVTSATANVVVTYAAGMNAVQYRTEDLSGVEEFPTTQQTVTTGSTTDTRVAVPFAVNGSTRRVKARTRNNTSGLWSAWDTNTVTVTYIPPAVSTLVSTAVDSNSYGYLHAISTVITNPAPTGGQPTVTGHDLFVRRVGSTDATGSKVATGIAAGATYVWRNPAAAAYQVRVESYAANGTRSTSAWTTVSGTNTIKGIELHRASDPVGTSCRLLFNDDGLEDSRQRESALLQYQGRTYPVAEFGASISRVLKVPLVTIKLADSTSLAALRALIAAQEPVKYRDKRGRKATCLLRVAEMSDVAHGYTTGLELTVLDDVNEEPPT